MTWYSASPTPHQKLIARLDEPSATLRFVRSCSSALSPDLMRDVEDRLGVPIVEAYGMTEATHQMTSNPLPPGQRLPGPSASQRGPRSGWSMTPAGTCRSESTERWRSEVLA